MKDLLSNRYTICNFLNTISRIVSPLLVGINIEYFLFVYKELIFNNVNGIVTLLVYNELINQYVVSCFNLTWR